MNGLWTASNRWVVMVILAGLIVLGAVQLFRHPAYVSDPQPAVPSRAGDLADRIDPNTADAATLAALPLIGERRAADIVAFRELHAGDRADHVVFRQLNDLLRIRGIGASTIDQLRPYLIFPPGDSPATRP